MQQSVNADASAPSERSALGRPFLGDRAVTSAPSPTHGASALMSFASAMPTSLAAPLTVAALPADRPVPPAGAPPADRTAAAPGRAPEPASEASPASMGANVSRPLGAAPRSGERALPCRVFDERSGIEWRISERDASGDPGSRAARCLLFDADAVVRRVWQYPADWRALPPDALLALMEHPVPRG